MQKLLVGSVCFALLSAVAAAAEAQVANVQAPKPALGITMNDNSLPGVTVMGVVPESPAARIGLQSGDRILAINGKPTSSFRDVSRVIETSRPNAPIELTVARGVWQGKLTVELGAASTIFTPTALRSLQQPAPAVAAPATVYYVPAPTEAWQFPNNMFDNGSRGAAASYGGGGY
jgi:membrane-associated protease RseP (regulator of RpoE activity)